MARAALRTWGGAGASARRRETRPGTLWVPFASQTRQQGLHSTRRCASVSWLSWTTARTTALLCTPRAKETMMSRALEACPSCHQQALLRHTTTDCACRVCEDCANQFLAQGSCGVCQSRFTEDALELPEDRDDHACYTDCRSPARACPAAAVLPARGQEWEARRWRCAIAHPGPGRDCADLDAPGYRAAADEPVRFAALTAVGIIVRPIAERRTPCISSMAGGAPGTRPGKPGRTSAQPSGTRTVWASVPSVAALSRIGGS
jgi:hypothetical protein